MTYLVSASQISTYRLCPAKWAFDKIGKIRGPASKAMVFGSEAHELLELWGRDAKELPSTAQGRAARIATQSGEIKQQGLYSYYEGASHTGKVLPGMVAEDDGRCKFVFHIDNVGYHGYIDYMETADDCITIRDYKFTADLKWAKAERDLLVDPQCIMYCMYAVECLDAEQVDFGLIYTERSGATDSRVVRVTLAANEIRERFDEHVAKYAREITRLKKENPKPLDVKRGERSACFAYGGCIYKKEGNCPGIRTSWRKKKMGLMDDLRKEVSGEAATQAPPPKQETVIQPPPFTVYLDCVPVGFPAPMLEQLLGPVVNSEGPWDAPMQGVHYVDLRGGARLEVDKFLKTGMLPPCVLAHSGSEMWRTFGDLITARCFLVRGG